MPKDKKDKRPVESFSEMVKEFGETISKIFNDPELKKKSREFARSAENSARAFGKRFKDEEVKEKFKDFKKAASGFGKSMSDYFKSDEESEEENEEESDWEKKIDEKMTRFSRRAEKAGKRFEKKMKKVGEEVDGYFKDTRGGRIIGYSFGIMWSVVFFVLFNFYSQYIAYYHYDGTWQRYPLLTEAFSQWLPVVSTALVAAMIGNILLLIYDGNFFRQIVRIVLNLFRIAAVISLLTIFPFDFTVFPRDLTGILNPIVIVVLLLIIIGTAIDTIVKTVRLVFFIGRSY